ncbi:hypothetical protein MRB53_019882 [Persea americana]|uniref:Uncharacterized protein n=1 Tax=Persea americana TaxID=3435 RepID=A0ACC2KZT6_PERAE|nr:hypothetical protein MRB53_019882 [Persea americana]
MRLQGGSSHENIYYEKFDSKGCIVMKQTGHAAPPESSIMQALEQAKLAMLLLQKAASCKRWNKRSERIHLSRQFFIYAKGIEKFDSKGCIVMKQTGHAAPPESSIMQALEQAK